MPGTFAPSATIPAVSGHASDFHADFEKELTEVSRPVRIGSLESEAAVRCGQPEGERWDLRDAEPEIRMS